MKLSNLLLIIYGILLIININGIDGSESRSATQQTKKLLKKSKSSPALLTNNKKSSLKGNHPPPLKRSNSVGVTSKEKHIQAAKHLQQIIMERLADRPTKVIGQYDLIKNAHTNDLLKLAETIKGCWIKSPSSKKAQEKSCWDFVKLIYSSKFEVHNGNELNRLKYLEFWHGSDFSMWQAMKLANKANSKYIDMCAGTISGQILSGWGGESYKKLEKWMKANTGKDVDLSDRNDALWTPMSAYLAEKYFTKERPIDAIAFMDYYRVHTGRQDHPYFANDEFPQLIKTDADNNNVYFLINERCATIVQQSKAINIDTDGLGLKCKAKTNCLNNNINDCACIKGLNYDKLIKLGDKIKDDKLDKNTKQAYKDLIKEIESKFGNDDKLLNMMKKRAWLILAVQNNEILCDPSEIERHVHARSDHELDQHPQTLQRVRVGRYTSNDDGSKVDAKITQLKKRAA